MRESRIKAKKTMTSEPRSEVIAFRDIVRKRYFFAFFSRARVASYITGVPMKIDA